MGRNAKTVELHQGGDSMLTSSKSVIKFYEDLIERCKDCKGKLTTYGFKIDNDFIKGLEVRLRELQRKLS